MFIQVRNYKSALFATALLCLVGTRSANAGTWVPVTVGSHYYTTVDSDANILGPDVLVPGTVTHPDPKTGPVTSILYSWAWDPDGTEDPSGVTGVHHVNFTGNLDVSHHNDALSTVTTTLSALDPHTFGISSERINPNHLTLGQPTSADEPIPTGRLVKVHDAGGGWSLDFRVALTPQATGSVSFHNGYGRAQATGAGIRSVDVVLTYAQVGDIGELPGDGGGGVPVGGG